MTRLNLERRAKRCAKTFLEGTFMCAPSFHVCTCTHAQLRGNIA